MAARQNGSYGGQERASRYDQVILSEWASRGGKAVLAKYGPEYFKELRKRRTHYPKYSESPVLQPNRRVLAAKENGRRGGMRRAEFYSPEHLRGPARLRQAASGSLGSDDVMIFSTVPCSVVLVCSVNRSSSAGPSAEERMTGADSRV